MGTLHSVAPSAIVGSWYGSDLGDSRVKLALTFLANGTYLLAEAGDRVADPSGQNGMELGTYAWDASSGALIHRTLIDTDGEWGLSHSIDSMIQVSGATLTLSGDGDSVSLTQASGAPAIVGGWYGGDLVFTFLSDGTYLLADAGDSADDPSGQNGMELGTYAWDAGTAKFTHNTLIDTNGEWGLSDSHHSSIEISGGTLTLLDDGDSISLSKVAANQVASTITGTAGNDQLSGTAIDDVVDGGTGLDTYVLNGAGHDFRITQSATGYTVKDGTGAEGSDGLTDVERVKFADECVALDVANGHAGTTARILGVVFGPSAITNKTLVGIGLALLDGGMSYPDLMMGALTAKLGDHFSNAAEVDLLYQNLFGHAPTSAESAFWSNAIDTAQFSQASLAIAGAELGINASNIDLVGLLQTGLEYLPYA